MWYSAFGRCGAASLVLIRIDCSSTTAATASATRLSRPIFIKTSVSAPQQAKALYSLRRIVALLRLALFYVHYSSTLRRSRQRCRSRRVSILGGASVASLLHEPPIIDTYLNRQWRPGDIETGYYTTMLTPYLALKWFTFDNNWNLCHPETVTFLRVPANEVTLRGEDEGWKLVVKVAIITTGNKNEPYPGPSHLFEKDLVLGTVACCWLT